MLAYSRLAGRRRLRRLLHERPERRRALIDAASRRALEHNWVREHGFTMPNRRKYPWQWLWDSCFHAIAWSAIGDPRCRTEMESLFALQLPNGFLPHMGYQRDPRRSLSLWRSAGRSDITQPPMYGHALRVLAERGFGLEHLHEPALDALGWLFTQRRDPASGLIRIVHPWESGRDDSPRWDGWEPRPFRERRWNRHKRELLGSLALSNGAATSNAEFEVAPAGFNALVAFNAYELAELTGDAQTREHAHAVSAALDAQWAAQHRTWGDVRLRGRGSGALSPTLDGLLGVLSSDDHSLVGTAFSELFATERFWRPFGPSGSAADDAAYQPRRYWRGDAWPQEIYVLMVAAKRRGRDDAARALAEKLVTGCTRSYSAERWNPETGLALGAVPQGWAALASEGALVLYGERRAGRGGA